MIFSNNLVIVQGFCAFDVDSRDTANSKLATFKVHVKEKVMRSDKTMTDISHYIECKAWGKTAENIIKHVSKGDYIHIMGKTVVDQWEKDGKKMRKQICEVSDFKNLTKLVHSTSGTLMPQENNQSFAAGTDTDDGLPAGFGAAVPAFKAPENSGFSNSTDDLEGLI